MPIYLRFPDLKGNLTSEGHSAAGASGGVWKTTNFLTGDPVGPSYGIVRLSRIALENGVEVNGHDPLPRHNVLKLFETAKRGAPVGRLYLGTDVGVFSEPLTGRTRLLMGSDQGVFSRPGMGLLKSNDGGKTW